MYGFYGGFVKQQRVHNGQSGFTLTELAVVLAIVAILIGASFMMFTPFLLSAKQTSTRARMETIADAIAIYVHDYNRLPCSASPNPTVEPFGFQRGSGADGQDINISCVGTDVEGIVPFKTLDLAEEQVKDAWGDYITYRITPAFALSFGDYPAANTDIHAACRYLDWMDAQRTSTVNRNPEKARFCCPPMGISSDDYYTDKDIVMLDTAGGKAVWPRTRNTDTKFYDHQDTRADIPLMDTVREPGVNDYETPAFILVSHGPNRFGAYTGKTSSDRMLDVNGVSGTDETENQDGDKTFILRDYTAEQSNSYYDDLVLWRTQNQIYSEFGDDSCLKP